MTELRNQTGILDEVFGVIAGIGIVSVLVDENLTSYSRFIFAIASFFYMTGFVITLGTWREWDKRQKKSTYKTMWPVLLPGLWVLLPTFFWQDFADILGIDAFSSFTVIIALGGWWASHFIVRTVENLWFRYAGS